MFFHISAAEPNPNRVSMRAGGGMPNPEIPLFRFLKPFQQLRFDVGISMGWTAFQLDVFTSACYIVMNLCNCGMQLFQRSTPAAVNHSTVMSHLPVPHTDLS
jgi:hypothetical protein